MIKKNQDDYYTAIQNCNNAGNSTEFIEFMLKMINETINEMNNSKEMKDKSILLLSENEQAPLGLAQIGFSLKDYNPPNEVQKEQLKELIKVILKDNKKEKNSF